MRGQEPDCQAHKAPQYTHPVRLQAARHPLHQDGGGGPESIAETVFDEQPELWVGDRNHPFSDLRRVSRPGGDNGSLLMPDHELVDEVHFGKEIGLDARLMVVWRRKSEQDVIIHSDQVSQFNSDEWIRFCQTQGSLPRRSCRGNWYDNAAVEAVFGSLRKEKILRHTFKSCEAARAEYLIILR